MEHMEKVSFIYGFFVFMSVTHGCFATLYAHTKIVINGNSTIVEKPLIISSWFPFDKNEHYWVRLFFTKKQSLWLVNNFQVAYGLQVFDGYMAALTVACTDILMFNMINYPTGQLAKLQHLVRNMAVYKTHFEAFPIFRKLVQRHKHIIKYVQSFCEHFCYLFFLFQLCGVVQSVYGHICHIRVCTKFSSDCFCFSTNFSGKIFPF